MGYSEQPIWSGWICLWFHQDLPIELFWWGKLLKEYLAFFKIISLESIHIHIQYRTMNIYSFFSMRRTSWRNTCKMTTMKIPVLLHHKFLEALDHQGIDQALRQQMNVFNCSKRISWFWVALIAFMLSLIFPRVCHFMILFRKDLTAIPLSMHFII